jgi:hypothetical protein
MNEKAQLLLIEYISDLKCPPFSFRKDYKRYHEVTLWTAEEILRKIRHNNKNNESVFCILEQFIDRMNYFSVIAKTEDAKMRFSIAYDTAVDIYDMFIAAELDTKRKKKGDPMNGK